VPVKRVNVIPDLILNWKSVFIESKKATHEQWLTDDWMKNVSFHRRIGG
jgi:hypothetical protein